MGPTVIPALALLAAPVTRADDVVDELIERTNRLRSFSARYELQGRSDEGADIGGILRLVYRDSEGLRVELRGDDTLTVFIVADGRIGSHLERSDGTVCHGEAEEDPDLQTAREETSKTFGERFPGLGTLSPEVTGGAFVRYEVSPGTESERPTFHLDAGYGRGMGPLLGWLAPIACSDVALEPEGDSYVWRPGPGLRVSLGRESGFIERIDVTFRGETKVGLRLLDLVLDEPVDDSEFRLPAADAVDEDDSKALAASCNLLGSRMFLDRLHHKVCTAVDDSVLEWDDDARAAVRHVLRDWHGRAVPVLARDGIETMRSGADRFCRYFQERKGAIEGSDAAGMELLESQRAEWERGLRESAEASVDGYLKIAATFPSESAPRVSRELRELELEVAEAVYREVFVEHLVEHFAHQMELATQGALPTEAR